MTPIEFILANVEFTLIYGPWTVKAHDGNTFRADYIFYEACPGNRYNLYGRIAPKPDQMDIAFCLMEQAIESIERATLSNVPEVTKWLESMAHGPRGLETIGAYQKFVADTMNEAAKLIKKYNR